MPLLVLSCHGCLQATLKNSLGLMADYRCRFGLDSVSVNDLAEDCCVPVVLKGVPRCVSKQHSRQTGVLLRAFQVRISSFSGKWPQWSELHIEGHKLESKP